MASLRLFTLIIILLSWRLSYFVMPCSETHLCYNNSPLCQKCAYNIILKENTKNHETLLCCDVVTEFEPWTQKLVNTTVTQVKVRLKNTCNLTAINFDFPLLDTFSISLSNNSLFKIRINVKTQNLREINLSYNKLQYVTKGMFNGFLNLRILVLRRNEILNILEESFYGLSKLELLDLSENNLTILANIFTPLKNLQHLNLSRNNIEFINENYFNNWLLQHLDVSHNNLKKVAPGALQLLPNLARLLLTDNPHLGITQLDTQLLVGTGRRLQQIDASRTGLYQVPEAFTHSVRFLSLVGNRIFAVRCGDLDSYPLLQSLDFSHNKIVSVEDDSLGRLEMLLFLNLNNNLIAVVPKTLPDGLKYLSMNYNSIKNLTKPDLKNLPNLRILLLKNNKVGYIGDNVLEDLLSLEVLDLSNNPIQILSPSTFDGPLSLKDLRLCYLNLSVPAKDGSFPMSSPESIQMLHLQSSPSLARQLLADSAALAALSHLQYLDLRMNNLSEIRNDLFFYLVQLKTLRLQGNGINCSAQIWLQDWMYWNKSVSNGESCYYSSLGVKDEVNKYNCTFPETFTISDSLPPVNLYSTEMINKLLRYYGYLNKTDKSKNSVKHLKKTKQFNINETTFSINFSGEHRKSTNNFTESISHKLREQAMLLSKLNIESLKFSKPGHSVSTSNQTKNYYNDTIFGTNKNKLGKRLNTPINITKETNSEIVTQYLTATKQNTSIHDSVDVNEKMESSPYQSLNKTYIEYMGTIAVCSLILIALVLWASFRLRYRRRHTASEEGAGDQIEVSNISGGVLW